MWVITGANGQLGRCLTDVLDRRGIDRRALGKDQLDITDAPTVSAMIREIDPTVVVNTAAWTSVDAAEDHPDQAFALNADGARNVASAARAQGASFVHVSTDYVFDGESTVPYGEADPTGPRSVYGQSKLSGERMVRDVLGEEALIVRTAWLYSARGANFVKTMTRRALASSAVKVVDDQHGQPTHAGDLAGLIVDLVAAGASGTHHGTSSGTASWCELTREIYRLLDVDTDLVTPCSSAEYPTKAARPRYSVLAHGRTVDIGVSPIREWKDALSASIDEIRAAVMEETP